MKVLRIEGSDGHGIYWGNNLSAFDCPWYYEKESAHPKYQDDSSLASALREAGIVLDKGEPNPSLIFGFLNKQQLRSWLYDDRVLYWLDENGFKLYEYDSPEAYVGHSQVIFRRYEDTPKTEINILKFIEEPL